MPDSVEKEFAFFREAALAISSSLNLSEALRALFDFVSLHFPLEGLTLHTFDPQMKSLHLLFLVTQNDYIYLDELISLPSKKEEAFLTQYEAQGHVLNRPSVMSAPVANRHNMAS